MRAEDATALSQLAYRYAAAIDACDAARLQAVFHPGARLRAWQPDAEQPFTDLRGAASIATIAETMRSMYRRTTHMMTNHLLDIGTETATGELLCTARHLTNDAQNPVSLTVIIRYLDEYVRGGTGWLIMDRRIRFLWSETHATAPSAMGRGP